MRKYLPVIIFIFTVFIVYALLGSMAWSALALPESEPVPQHRQNLAINPLQELGPHLPPGPGNAYLVEEAPSQLNWPERVTISIGEPALIVIIFICGLALLYDMVIKPLVKKEALAIE